MYLLFLVRLPVRQSLAFDGLESIRCALAVIDSKRRAIVLPEVKLSEIAMQVLAFAMLIRASHAALEYGEHAFDSVRVRIATHVLACTVIYGLMIRKAFTEVAIKTCTVGHQARIRGNVLLERALDSREQLAGDVRGADFAAALNQGEHGFLVPVAATLVTPGLTSNVGFVSLNRLTTGAHKAARNISHGMTDTVGHEPRRLIGHSKRAMELMAADAFLTRTQQVDRRKPFGQRNLRAFKDGPDGHAELLAAVGTLPQAGAVGLTLKLIVLADGPAMRTRYAVRPAQGFEVFAGLVVVAEVVCGEGGSHDFSPLDRHGLPFLWVCKVYNSEWKSIVA